MRFHRLRNQYGSRSRKSLISQGSSCVGVFFFLTIKNVHLSALDAIQKKSWRKISRGKIFFEQLTNLRWNIIYKTSTLRQISPISFGKCGELFWNAKQVHNFRGNKVCKFTTILVFPKLRNIYNFLSYVHDWYKYSLVKRKYISIVKSPRGTALSFQSDLHLLHNWVWNSCVYLFAFLSVFSYTGKLYQI